MSPLPDLSFVIGILNTVRKESEPITDLKGRYLAPPQSWPEPAPDRPRTANVILRKRGEWVSTIHGVQLVIGTWDGASICRSLESRQWVRFEDGALEIEASYQWSEDEAYAEYQRRLVAAA